MAIKATIFKANLQIADMERHYYQDHALTLARHPSETDERMMVRLLAFALHAHEHLEFGQGMTDDEVLLAGLLHDAGKGRTGVWPRVAYALGQAYGTWVWRVAGIVPPMRRALDRLLAHAETSARLAERAGASPRTVDLIRHQEAPIDPDAGRLLKLADEAN